MKNILILAGIFLFCNSSILAKKLGDVPEELLKATAHELDSSAHASYYKKNVRVTYNFNVPRKITLDSEYHYIIKIYSEEGEKYATFEIPLYRKSGSSEGINKIKAVSVNWENGKAVKTKLDKKDIFKEKTSDNWTQVKFALPNVKAGTVIEVKYTVSTPYIRTIPKWYFQNYIPTDESIYKIEVPEYFVLTPVPTGSVSLDMQREKVSGSRHGEVRFTITGLNVPSIKEDKYVLNENDYRSGIKYEIESVQFPGGDREYYSKDWAEIARDLMKAQYFGKQITKKLKDLSPIVEEASALPQTEKIKFLYDYVRTNYSWNDSYGLGAYDGLKKVVEEKSGSSAELNLLLLNLLKASGVTSHGFAISSRSNGLLNTNFPSISSLNYLLVLVPSESYLLLDASSKYSPMGELPVRSTTINGILIDAQGARVIDLDDSNNFKIQTVSSYTVDVENNKLIGESQRKRSDYAATRYRIQIEEKSDEEQQEAENEEDDDQGDDIESYDLENTYEVTSLENLEDIYKPISMSYSEELNTVMKQVGDKIFINATLDFGVKKNPFEEETREFPVFYNYKIHSQSIASIEIPEGYHVESQPKDIRAVLPNKLGSFSYTTKVNAGSLNINYKFKINETLIYAHDYPALKAIYDMVINTYNEKIILSKGEPKTEVSNN